MPLGEAKGTIKVPASVRICYEPGPKFFSNPQILLKFPPDSIEYIKMKFTPMEDNEEHMSDHAVEFVAHLRGLRIVDFDKVRHNGCRGGETCRYAEFDRHLIF